MKNNISLSIIIPHKNIPELLTRCLNSIPNMESIEIIVVDDNSSNICEENFPGISRQNVKVFFSKKNITAGGARNIGLRYATGDWVLFADADDFFNDGFHETIQSYFDSNNDVIYFGLNSKISESLVVSSREGDINNLLKKAESECKESEYLIRYKYLYPYCKLIKLSFIRNLNLKFDEVIASNDTMFGIKVGIYSNKVDYNSSEIYCLTLRDNSLVTCYKYENLKSRLMVSFNLFNLLRQHNLEKYAQNSFGHLLQIRKVSYFKMLTDIAFLFKGLPIIVIIRQVYQVFKNFIKK